MPIKVLLIEDHDVVRRDIRALLGSEPEIEIVEEACSCDETINKLSSVKPNIVVLDIDTPTVNGPDCIRRIKNRYSSAMVLVLSKYENENHLINVLDAGANGYVLKNGTWDELLFAIKKVYNDGLYISPEFTVNILSKYKLMANAQSTTSKHTANITEKEMDVLKLIAQGLTNVQIANKLFTSVRTIETRRKSLLDKTKTTNTATLIRYAVLDGLIK